MNRMLSLVIGVTVCGLAALACGGDDADGLPSPSGPSSAIGPGISIREAMDSDLEGPLLVNGYLVVVGDEVLLCEALAESFPPQCAGASLVIEGLDLEEINGIESEGDVMWTDAPVQLLGSVDDDTISVAANETA